MSVTPSSSDAANTGAADEEVSIAIEQTPLPMFVQILYGNVLKRPYAMDAAVSARTDPVTFKSSKPLSKRRLNELSANLLRSYGLGIEDLDGVIRITAQNSAGVNSTRLTVGRQVPENTGGLSQVHQYVELEYVKNSEMVQWLRQILGQRVQLQEDNARNAFLLSGSASEIRAAITLIDSFDQPRMRGKVSARLNPANISPVDLANRLNEMLNAQGISASQTVTTAQATVLLIPMQGTGSVFAFATSQALLDHTVRWAMEVDKPNPAGTSLRGGLFTYPVKYADAQALAQTLGDVLSAGTTGAVATPQPVTGGGTAATPASRTFGRVTVNNATNTLIVKGTSSDEQQQILDLLRELDRPAKSAWIEVLIAEVTSEAKDELGVDWSGNTAGVGVKGPLKTGGLTGAGLNLSYVNSASTLLAKLSALSTQGKSRIVSYPRVLARNGETASIRVGREVPVVTSVQSTGQTGGSNGNQLGVLQQIQYRSTGVILQVRPVINSGNRLDLEVTQEVSSAIPTETGVTSTPTITNRHIETKLSLRDGSSVLLGGLIQRNDNSSSGGLPGVKDIPILGGLFGKWSKTSDDTELLVMITPYVVNDDFEAEQLAESVRATFGKWAQELSLSRVVKERPVPMPPAAPAERTPQLETPQYVPSQAMPLPQTRAPASRPAEGPPDDSGIITSKPLQVAPTPSLSTEPPKPGDKRPADGAASKPAPAPGPAVTLPGGVKGNEVTDPAVLDEIKKLIKQK
ncbi:hypothetical protein H5407_03145 [Mitsuaria sp. WAJ17]|uniref:secretin N-terminal domain-containing protein n=1 Tax=Mitsuaria sp. WAJ17 TaxID=2761452 RepID=UPI0015FFB8B6|nr:secretin N-terminal domain-containing protein [Mitsuaria sp. WAJ17]MBB2484216.1 hypothetical protein [Mitsuaria sp. WAJ17]